MATTKKTTGILGKVKAAVSGMFSSEPARKSPKRVAAGKKAATTAKVTQAVKATRKAVKKVAKKVTTPTKKTAAKKGK
jgi:hypothetical protein